MTSDGKSITNNKINIFWHIYIDPNDKINHGINIIQRQWDKLIESGLIDNAKTINIGFISKTPNDFPISAISDHPKVQIITRASEGWECVTTFKLKEYCDALSNTEGEHILYLHNRGASRFNNTPMNRNAHEWTLMLEHYNINNWRKATVQLATHYTAGCELIKHHGRNEKPLPPDQQKKGVFHYQGNFWWATSTYIRKLCTPRLDCKYSGTEDWILSIADSPNFPLDKFAVLHRTSFKKYGYGVLGPSVFYPYCFPYTPLHWNKDTDVPTFPNLHILPPPQSDQPTLAIAEHIQNLCNKNLKSVLFISPNSSVPSDYTCRALVELKLLLGKECHDIPHHDHLYLDSHAHPVPANTVGKINSEHSSIDQNRQLINNVKSKKYDLIIYAEPKKEGLTFQAMIQKHYPPPQHLFIMQKATNIQEQYEKQLAMGYNILCV